MMRFISRFVKSRRAMGCHKKEPHSTARNFRYNDNLKRRSYSQCRIMPQGQKLLRFGILDCVFHGCIVDVILQRVLPLNRCNASGDIIKDAQCEWCLP